MVVMVTDLFIRLWWAPGKVSVCVE